MKLGVLISENSWYWRDLQRAAEPTVQLRALSWGSLSAAAGKKAWLGCRESDDLTSFDALLVRTMPPGSLEQVVFRMNALYRLAAFGVTVINPPRALEMAIDKYLALAELQAAGLPVPETRISQTWEQAMDDFSRLGGDVVVKPIFGGEGRGIARITDEAVAWRIFKTYSQLGLVIYQQKFIPHAGYDTRVLVLGSRLFGIRRSNPSDWRTNISRGAMAESIDIDDELGDLSVRAAEAVGAPWVGVDVLTSLDGQRYVLEVNAVPGWRAVSRTLDLDIAALLVDWIRQQVTSERTLEA